MTDLDAARRLRGLVVRWAECLVDGAALHGCAVANPSGYEEVQAQVAARRERRSQLVDLERSWMLT